MARRAPYGKAPPTWQRPYIMRWIEAASAGTPARAQPAPPLIRLWRFPCPFQRRTAERYKGAAISVLTLPCQDGTDSSNPLSSSSESANFQYLSVGVISQRRRHDGSRRRSSRLPVSAARAARLHEIGEFLREVA